MKLHRESVADVLSIVESYGPWGADINEGLRFQIILADEVKRLLALINTPELNDFAKGVVLEAVHQQERWPAGHDEGKTDADWFWLIGYLAQKALYSAMADDHDKMRHHVITTAAALANWHLQMMGKCNMRPGIATPADTAQP
jgi:hypothetical protein